MAFPSGSFVQLQYWNMGKLGLFGTLAVLLCTCELAGLSYMYDASIKQAQ